MASPRPAPNGVNGQHPHSHSHSHSHTHEPDDGGPDEPASGRVFPSLLHPAPRTPSAKALHGVLGAYNRFAVRVSPYVHLRPFRIPHEAVSSASSRHPDDHHDGDGAARDEEAAAAGAHSSSHTHNGPGGGGPPPPSPGTVFQHLTQHDTLQRLNLNMDILPGEGRDGQASRNGSREGEGEGDGDGDEFDTAGIRFSHLQHGLSPEQVEQRREKYGKNSFAEREHETPLDKLLEQLSEPMILLLLASATVSFAIGQKDDAFSITLAIAIVVTVGWVQEQRSEKSLASLNSLVPNYCHLIRPQPPTDSMQADTPRSSQEGEQRPRAGSRSAANNAPPLQSQPEPDSDGAGFKVMADELVPGDVVTFSTGDRIPADIRLFHACQLEVDESTLTGEITPAKKYTHVVSPRWPLDQVNRRIAERTADNSGEQSDQHQHQQLPQLQAPQGLHDQQGDDHASNGQSKDSSSKEQSSDNIVFMGTMVKSGYGRGVVIGTGLETEFGGVFSMVDDVDEKRTPLQQSMDDLAKKLTVASFVVIGVIFVVGTIQERSILELATIAISLAVAAIPEGLPIVVTVTLALGVLRMSKRRAIVKHLPSVETLGSVSVICTDKTGTLTQNHMTVVKLFTLQDGVVSPDQNDNSADLSTALARTLLVANVCNRASWDKEGSLTGSPTEVAMLDVLDKFQQRDCRHSFHQVDEVPFDTNWKYMTVVGHLEGDSAREEWEKQEAGYTKGAPEAVLARCSHAVDKQGKTVEMTDSLLQQLQDTINQLASEGLRVLATATGPTLSQKDHDEPEKASRTLTFCGLHAMQDPPRMGVKPAIEKLTGSGVHIVMVTGDAPSTAVGIAKQLGILHHSSSPSPTSSPRARVGASGVMTGYQVDQMSPEQLSEIAPSISVFARTTPRHKMTIISAFQRANQVVAMTGDGVNDAPALKMADIGIAMGASGTDVAKEAADVILVDDNFVTILNAVEEGKAIFCNIQNFLAFQLSTSVAALFLILLSIMFGKPLPLNPMQVLLINLACDGPPAQSLGVDPADASVFNKPPRPKKKAVLDKRVFFNILSSAALILGGTLFVYVHEAASTDDPGQRDMAMTFVTFVTLDLITAVQSRGLHVKLFANTVMVITIAVSYAVLLSLIYVPPLQAIFQTIPLSPADLLYITALTGLAFGVYAVRREWQRRRDRAHEQEAWERTFA